MRRLVGPGRWRTGRARASRPSSSLRTHSPCPARSPRDGHRVRACAAGGSECVRRARAPDHRSVRTTMVVHGLPGAAARSGRARGCAPGEHRGRDRRGPRTRDARRTLLAGARPRDPGAHVGVDGARARLEVERRPASRAEAVRTSPRLRPGNPMTGTADDLEGLIGAVFAHTQGSAAPTRRASTHADRDPDRRYAVRALEELEVLEPSAQAVPQRAQRGSKLPG